VTRVAASSHSLGTTPAFGKEIVAGKQGRGPCTRILDPRRVQNYARRGVPERRLGVVVLMVTGRHLCGTRPYLPFGAERLRVFVA
jgi:hypothetical protein